MLYGQPDYYGNIKSNVVVYFIPKYLSNVIMVIKPNNLPQVFYRLMIS